MIKSVLLVLFLLVVGFHCLGQTPLTDDQIRELLRRRITNSTAPGIVVGLIGPGGSRIIAAGQASLDTKAPVDGDTLFEIGSVSKVFTGLLLADMTQRGDVKLDDPISNYLPASVHAPSRNGRQITLLDLAEQRSGLPRMPDNFAPRDDLNPYADYTFDDLCSFLSDYKLTRDPGEKYEYSNLGFGLLGSLLARRAGTTYEAAITEHVLRPLGLTDTAITLDARLKPRLATPYNAAWEPVHPWDQDALAGAGAIRSSAHDMLKFLSANMQLTESGLWPAMEMMQQPRAGTDATNTRIGLAWHMTYRNGKRVIWHNGETGGYHAFVGFDPTNKAGVVVLANSESSIDDIGFHLLDNRRPLARLKARKKSAAEVSVAPARLDRYVGRYQLNESAFFNVKRDGNHLLAQLTGQGYYEIYPKSASNFFYKVVDAQIDFTADAAGKTQSLTLHQNGVDQTAEKISNQPPAERQAVKLDTAVLDKYCGEYQLAPDAVFTIRRNGSRLLARLTGQSYLEIFPENETEFFYEAVDAQITFVRDANGATTALILHQNGDQQANKTK